MKRFSVSELIKIAEVAVEMGLIKVGHENWHLNSEDYDADGDGCFDYRCDTITLESMYAWDELRAVVEGKFNAPMSLYIGHRGEYEDTYNVYVIEFTENIEERKVEAERKRKEREKHDAMWALKAMKMKAEKKANTTDGTVTKMGDIDALAALKNAMESC